MTVRLFDSLVVGDFVEFLPLKMHALVKRVCNLSVDVMLANGAFMQTHRQFIRFITRPQKAQENMPRTNDIKITITILTGELQCAIIAERDDLAYLDTFEFDGDEIDWNKRIDAALDSLSVVESVGLPDIKTTRADEIKPVKQPDEDGEIRTKDTTAPRPRSAAPFTKTDDKQLSMFGE